jgi:hypothetical protein
MHEPEKSYDFLNAYQAADYMGVDLSTLRDWRVNEGLPWHRVGSRRIYCRAELALWFGSFDTVRPLPRPSRYAPKLAAPVT